MAVLAVGKYIKSDFARNVLTLMSGTALAQIIPLILTPLLTRYFSPEQFGLYAFLFSLISFLGVVSNGRYELAIILPKKDNDACELFLLCIYICFFTSIAIFIFGLIYNFSSFHFNCFDKITKNYILISIGTLGLGIFNAFNYLCNRGKMYEDISKTLVIKSAVANLIPLILYPLYQNEKSLLIGFIVSLLCSNLYIGFKIKRKYSFTSFHKAKELKKIAIEYSVFPTYSLVGAGINALSVNGLAIFMSYMFLSKEVGYYVLVQRLFGIASSLLGRSFSQVYFEKAAREKRETGSCLKVFLKSLKHLTTSSVIALLCLYFFSTYFITLVFGDNWAKSINVLHVLLPYFMTSFISSSLSVTLTVYQKTKLELIIHILIFSTVLFLFYYNYSMKLPFVDFLGLFSIVMSVEYLVFILIYYLLAKGNQCA